MLPGFSPMAVRWPLQRVQPSGFRYLVGVARRGQFRQIIQFRRIIVRLRERDAEMAHQSESGRNRNERQEHDRKARSYEETTGNPYHLSNAARTVVGVLALIVVIALTALFVSGSIHW